MLPMFEKGNGMSIISDMIAAMSPSLTLLSNF